MKGCILLYINMNITGFIQGYGVGVVESKSGVFFFGGGGGFWGQSLESGVFIFDISLKQFSVKMNANLSAYLISLTVTSLL